MEAIGVDVYGQAQTVRTHHDGVAKVKGADKKTLRKRKGSDVSDKELEEHEKMTDLLYKIKWWVKTRALTLDVGEQGSAVETAEFGNFDLQAVRETDVNGDEIFVLEADEKEPGVLFVQIVEDWRKRSKAADMFLGDLKESLFKDDDCDAPIRLPAPSTASGAPRSKTTKTTGGKAPEKLIGVVEKDGAGYFIKSKGEKYYF